MKNKKKQTPSIGSAIKELREWRGVTQQILYENTGFVINFLSAVENGRKNISHGTAIEIARALGVPTCFIYILADNSNDELVLKMQKQIRKQMWTEKQFGLIGPAILGE